MASAAPKLKTAFKKVRSVTSLYTGGPTAVTSDGRRLLTCVHDEVIVSDVASGAELGRLASDTEPVSALYVSPSARHVAVFTSSLSLRIFELPGDIEGTIQPVRVAARAHDAPVHVCVTDPSSTYLASGSADGVVKIWDIVGGYITHVFKGHGGVVSALLFHVQHDPSSAFQATRMQIITGSVDTRIRIFDLTSNANKSAGVTRPDAVLEGHVSVPRGFDISQDGRWLLSGGRDSVVLLWDLSSEATQRSSKPSKGKAKQKSSGSTPVKTIPVLERVEAVGFLTHDDASTSASANQVRFYTGGENGAVKIWDLHSGKLLYSLGNEYRHLSDGEDEQRQIMQILYVPSQSVVASVHADQNILFYSLSTRTLMRQIIGFNDEIVDLTYISPSKDRRDTHVALATNSSLIRIYDVTTLDSRLLDGHTDIVLALDHDADGRVLASGSKDQTARLWVPRTEGNWEYTCIAVCNGHTQSIGALAMARSAEGGLRFMFTGSQDRTIKMWDLSAVQTAVPGAEPVRCTSLATQTAHDKDINALDVAPNDRFLVSGSQDRTAKIFAIEYTVGSAPRGELRLVGTCRGHKRGVWTVRFGRAERVLATGSSDKTVKLWNLSDFSCVKTFEGHTNSVLRVDFFNAGMQLVSSASDGLVKVWNVREEECVTTLDNHTDKIWALAVSHDEKTIVSAAADSVVTFWEDCTAEEEQAKEENREALVQQEQDFLNYLSLHDYRKAIQLALSLGQPGRLMSLFKDLRSSANKEDAGSITGRFSVDEVFRTLEGPDLAKLMRYARDWNANAKTSIVAQEVLFAIMKLRTAEEVLSAFGAEAQQDSFMDGVETSRATGAGPTAIRELMEALIPYTERHLNRIERLVQESYMVDYVLNEMDDGMFENADDIAMDIDTTA
ncbi:WD40 repeat-like protein [Fistulina hepatica ATCC 64428]|uniref:WD40 repeat-like protein n=1 Tax=Fistulina hepatica ATCC 64428 TaxID=1128425 RepID=A0A0D7AGM5_9AGAR|nr:WD40 repeat-like protein [Fistulina hepatica ATCC 64428]